MEIRRISANDYDYKIGCAKLLAECFEHCWNTMNEAFEEIDHCFEDNGIVIIAIDNESVIGFIGGHIQYKPNGWELHPLAVSIYSQRKGIGSELVKAFENEVKILGGTVIFLGADDESGATSLSGCDLFENTFEKIRDIKNLKNHPFEFYMKNGYQIVGVLPDVNGYGKPDIHMAKRIRK